MSEILDSLVFDRMQSDVTNRTERGSYGAADLNRVGAAANYIRGMLAAYGYTVGAAFRQDWTDADIPRQSDMAVYISGLVRLRDSLRFYPAAVPALPATMERFTFEAANQIEKMLSDLGRAVEDIPTTWFEAGMIEGGVSYA